MTLAPAIFIQGPLTLAASLDTLADRLAAGDVLDLPVSTPIEAVDDDLAELAAATQRVVAAVQRSHALEAAVHELFEAMSSHLRLDYLGYEALYRVIDHTRATGGAIVLAGHHPLDVVASVDFALEDAELEGLVEQALRDPGPSQLAVGGDVPSSRSRSPPGPAPSAPWSCSASSSTSRCAGSSRCSPAPSASRSATPSPTPRPRRRPRRMP